MSRTRLIVLAALVLTVVGFFLMRAPAPVIALAAEPVISIGSYQITNTILSAWVVIVLLAIAAFVVYRRTRDIESALVPRGFQNLVEAIYDAFMNIAQQVGGERNGRRFFPFVFTIFIFLLIGNWFALFPWNNVIGPVENYRYHYLHEMEISVVEVVEDLESGERELSSGEIDAINRAFQSSFFMPIHFSDYETGSFQETQRPIRRAHRRADGRPDQRDRSGRARRIQFPSAAPRICMARNWNTRWLNAWRPPVSARSTSTTRSSTTCRWPLATQNSSARPVRF